MVARPIFPSAVGWNGATMRTPLLTIHDIVGVRYSSATARLRLMHMPDDRVGSVAKSRICGEGAK